LTRAKRKYIFKYIFIYAALIFFAAVFLVPIGVMISTSMKSPPELVNVLALPKGFYWENHRAAFEMIGRGMLNSLLITLPAVFISSFVGALGAYPLSQFRFKGDQLVYMFLLAGLFVPFQIVLIPLFQIMRELRLYDSIPGLWLVHTVYGIPICTFYLRNFFATIPKSLLEASLIDGCSIAGYFFRILLPLSKPGFAALIILQARAIWNDLLFGLTLTRSATTRPVTVELSAFVGMTDVQYGHLMAASLWSILPTTIIFLVFQKHFIRGLLGGSIKS
jgi:ABC-type glycerol-3-phosphate transport system permease component